MSNEMLFLVLIAMSVALIGWSASQVVVARLWGERRKLHDRMSDSGARRGGGESRRPSEVVTLRKQEARWNSRLLQQLENRVVRAFPDLTVYRFLGIAASLAGMVFGLFYLLLGSIVVPALLGLGAGSIPFLVLHFKRARRQRQLTDQLPESLDFLSRILRAGHSLTTGFQMMGDELPEPIASEFRRCYDQHSLGQPIEEAMKEAAIRVESEDFAFFVTAVLIQRQTGGDLAEVLDKIAAMVRARIRLSQRVKTLTAEGRVTGWVLVALPMVVLAILFVLNPEYAGQLIKTELGRIMLGIALGLQALGMLAIRQIVNVKV